MRTETTFPPGHYIVTNTFNKPVVIGSWDRRTIVSELQKQGERIPLIAPNINGRTIIASNGNNIEQELAFSFLPGINIGDVDYEKDLKILAGLRKNGIGYSREMYEQSIKDHVKAKNEYRLNLSDARLEQKLDEAEKRRELCHHVCQKYKSSENFQKAYERIMLGATLISLGNENKHTRSARKWVARLLRTVPNGKIRQNLRAFIRSSRRLQPVVQIWEGPTRESKHKPTI